MKHAAGFPAIYPEGRGEKIICLKNRHDLGLVNGMFVSLSDLQDEDHLAFTAASEQDQPLLLALVTLGALATLLAFAFADWLHARLDRRAGGA